MQTLRMGSTGSDVKKLQTGLNLLPSNLLALAVDGIFGPKTYERVKEYQLLAKIVVDGIVGPQTWNAMSLLLGTLDRIVETNRLRDEIVSVATQELEKFGMTVYAKRPGALDPVKKKHFRAGYNRLLEYFRIAAPDPKNHGKTVFDEDAIIYLNKPGELSPCPNWCGIFCVWAHKMAHIPVGNWKLGGGIYHVSGFRHTDIPQKGDVWYVGGKYDHMALIERVYLLNGRIMIDTIDGNSEPDSTINKNPRFKKAKESFYTAF